MATTTHPSKETVHSWFMQRRAEKTPPPSPEQIRRELGWDLVRPMSQMRQETHR